MSAYAYNIVVLIAVYSVVALSLDVLVGQLGLMALSQAAYFGIGAYSAAIAINQFGVSLPVALFVAILAGAVFSFFVSIPSLRLRGDYFVVCAFAFQMLIFSLLNNSVDLTGGPLGITVTQPLGHAPISVEGSITLVPFVLAAFVLLWKIKVSSFGRLLRAIREDEMLAEALGKNTTLAKICAFALSTAITAGAGAIYAQHIQYIDPSNFSIVESVLILAMVLLWRPGTMWGPCLGAILVVGLPELFRLGNMSSAAIANLQQIFFSTILMIVVLLRKRMVFTGGGR